MTTPTPDSPGSDPTAAPASQPAEPAGVPTDPTMVGSTGFVAPSNDVPSSPIPTTVYTGQTASPTYPGQPVYPAHPLQQAPYAYPAYVRPPAGYGASGYGPIDPNYPAYTPYLGPSVRQNGLAVAAMVCGIVGVVTLPCSGLSGIGLLGASIGGIIGLLGAIMGHTARGQIRRTNQLGDGMAIAGIVTGWIALILSSLGWILVIASWSIGT